VTLASVLHLNAETDGENVRLRRQYAETRGQNRADQPSSVAGEGPSTMSDQPDLGRERIQSSHWDEILTHYRYYYDVDGPWGEYRPMVRLVEEIAASSYAPVLFGKWTGFYRMDYHRQGQLNLARTPSFIMHHEMLAVSFVPADDWFLFEYFEAAYAYRPKPWATICAASEGFEKLEWVLQSRLRWFKRSEVRRPTA
jgi:hypothetical protein